MIIVIPLSRTCCLFVGHPTFTEANNISRFKSELESLLVLYYPPRGFKLDLISVKCAQVCTHFASLKKVSPI